MAQVSRWPLVRRQVFGKYAAAKQIGPQPQNAWGNTNVRILQIQFRNKTYTSPTLAITQVWIIGMDSGFGTYPLKGDGSWVWIMGYGSHVGAGYGSGLENFDLQPCIWIRPNCLTCIHAFYWAHILASHLAYVLGACLAVDPTQNHKFIRMLSGIHILFG